MIDLPTPQDVEILAVKAGISTAKACKMAHLSPAVFHRWKAGGNGPKIKNLQAIIDVLKSAIEARAK